MNLQDITIKKLYFSISEVCESIGVRDHTIRFWEDEFTLNIYRDRIGRRRFSVKDVGKIAIIARLVKHLHIPSAREHFKKGTAEALLSILEPEVKEPKL